ncbi:hypothetical protein L195_g005425 [Trifolium pratense]|uniref:Uncharacterized protein n=1 Tax=Trifolium pratense TaxID=57577 RepID=A0A2K3P0R9_TRIPR|nr:hypothetical protein L195_g005425 [Trifolium pratense]
MTIQPKPEPGSPPVSTSTNPNEIFEQKPIPDLIKVLRGTYQFETFETVEGVLVNRDKRLREKIQQLEKTFEWEKLQIQEKLQMEVLSRIQAEEEVRKREELCEKGKKVQESYEDLLKEVKINGLADSNMIKDLRKKNNELECEVKNLKEKGVDDGNKLDVIRRKNAELASNVLELSKMKEKWVEDSNELDAIRRKNSELESEVLELRKLKEKCVDDGNKLDVIRRKNAELESEVLELRKLKEKCVDDENKLDVIRRKNEDLESEVSELRKMKEKLGEENSKLAHEKRKVEILDKLLCTRFRDLQGRVSKLEGDSKLWMNVDASDGGNSEGEPRANHMVADFEDNGGNNEEEPWMNVDVSDGENSEEEPRADPDTDFEDNGEEDDMVEAAPLPRIEDAPHSLGVAASTQPQNIGGNDAQGASSGSHLFHVTLPKKAIGGSLLAEYNRPAEEAALEDKFMRQSPNFSLEDRDVLQELKTISEKCWMVYTRKPKKTVEMAGSSRAKGRAELVNGIEVINLDDDDDYADDDCRTVSQGVNGKTAIVEFAVKDEYPSSSVATQQKSKITNAVVDTVKRKFHFAEISSSTSSSSDDSSSLDNLTIRSVVSQGKKKKL